MMNMVVGDSNIHGAAFMSHTETPTMPQTYSYTAREYPIPSHVVLQFLDRVGGPLLGLLAGVGVVQVRLSKGGQHHESASYRPMAEHAPCALG